MKNQKSLMDVFEYLVEDIPTWKLWWIDFKSDLIVKWYEFKLKL